MRYQVGDKVRILVTPPNDEQAEDIWVQWVADMDDYCGMEATITQAGYSDMDDDDYYRIDLDEGRFAWCNACFTDIVEVPELDLDETDLFAMLNI